MSATISRRGRPAGRPPSGMTGSCLWALGNLGGTATTAEVRGWLTAHGEKLTAAQARTSLQSLSRRKPPLAELARQGWPSAGSAGAGLWRLTEHGHALLAPAVSRG